MGEGPGGAPTLYFEIRSQGKPIDPLKLLPRR
jgi:septal ring factor EnvC (AmiA/AmiB activator)